MDDTDGVSQVKVDIKGNKSKLYTSGHWKCTRAFWWQILFAWISSSSPLDFSLLEHLLVSVKNYHFIIRPKQSITILYTGWKFIM